MLGLLRLPNFTETFVTFFAFANLSNLCVKTFQLFPLRVGWNFDRALFWHERDLVISIFVGRAVEDRDDAIADGHVVSSPTRVEQNAIAIFRGTIRKRDDKQFT